MSTQMAAPLLTEEKLAVIREHLRTRGGFLFHKMCPRPDCHSAVARHKDMIVCVTCGWFRPQITWGEEQLAVTPEQVAAATGGDFRALALLVDPDRWQRLIQRAQKRRDMAAAAELEVHTKHLKPPRISADDRPSATEGSAGVRGQRLCPRLGEQAPKVLIYTDGGCDPNPGPGGWAAILWSSGWEMELAGGARDTTNNRMELTAPLMAIRALKMPSQITIVTDSSYVFNGMTEWITGWSKKRWRRKTKPVPNTDLWKPLLGATLQHETYWSWTRGHAGQPENERCDELADRMMQHPGLATKAIWHERRVPRNDKPRRVSRVGTAPVSLD